MSKPRPPHRPAGLDPEDDELWSRVADTVTPNPNRADPPVTAAPQPAPGAGDAKKAPRQVQPAIPRATAQPAPKPLPELRHGDTPGVDRRTATRLRRGQFPIDGTLDLHGRTREAAETALRGFVERHAAGGSRCVLVVTGKGLSRGGEGSWDAGVLRAALPDWLNRPPLRDKLLGFSYAQPEHGGTGAVYVLLRRAR